MHNIKHVLLIVLFTAGSLLAASAARAQTCVETGSSSESHPGQWAAGLNVDLSGPCSFEHTFAFPRTVRTRVVHVSYDSNCADDSVLFSVKTPDGSLLFGPVNMILVVNSNTLELSVNNKMVNSITVSGSSGCTAGGFELQLFGTDLTTRKNP